MESCISSSSDVAAATIKSPNKRFRAALLPDIVGHVDHDESSRQEADIKESLAGKWLPRVFGKQIENRQWNDSNGHDNAESQNSRYSNHVEAP